MAPPVDLDRLSPAELKAWVGDLLEKIAALEQKLCEQRAEIARLKGLKGRPEIKPRKPSGMEQASSATPLKTNGKRRRGRGKPAPVAAVEDRVVRAQVPAGSRFKSLPLAPNRGPRDLCGAGSGDLPEGDPLPSRALADSRPPHRGGAASRGDHPAPRRRAAACCVGAVHYATSG